jgi:SNF2 family DNA or RNA helicase
MRHLRSYQEDMVSHILQSKHPTLWVEMRLGKTLTCIRAANREKPVPKRILVIAPNSALRGWITELIMEGEPGPALLKGSRKRRLKLFHEGRKWCLINKEGYRSLPEIGRFPWDWIILDESASCIRYPKTQITRWFLANFQKAKKRVVMAGRPDPQNRLLDYYPQMAWASGNGWMGCKSYWQFRVKYFIQAGYDWVPKSKVRKKILDQVSHDSFVLQREHANLDVPKIWEPRFVEFTQETKRVYKRAEKEWILEHGKGETWTKYAIVAYQWLRQLAGGFIDGNLVWDGKLKELNDLVEGELSGQQVVIWCAYNREIEMIAHRLGDEATWIHGALSLKERHKRFELFASGEYRVLICQVRIAETGEDLSAADVAIYYSLPFGVLSFTQSQDRILGDLTKKGVLLVSLQTEGTVDEDVWKALSRKDERGAKFLDLVRQEMVRRHEKRSDD